jgi:hypothetical protein
LESYDILTLRDLLETAPEELLSLGKFGQKTLRDIYASLESLGFPVPKDSTMVTKRSAKKGSSRSLSPTETLRNVLSALYAILREASNTPGEDCKVCAYLAWLIDAVERRDFGGGDTEEVTEMEGS